MRSRMWSGSGFGMLGSRSFCWCIYVYFYVEIPVGFYVFANDEMEDTGVECNG